MNIGQFAFMAAILAIPLWAFVIYPPKPDNDVRVLAGGLVAILVCLLVFVVILIANS